MEVVYPYHLHALSEDIWTGTLHKASKRYSHWGLRIAGPFCQWPKRLTNRGYHQTVARIADGISRDLGLHVHARANGDSVEVGVVLSQSDKDRLIQNEYRRATRKR